MIEWRFGEYAEDGEAWLLNPTQLQVYVDFRHVSTTRRPEWRRLMVVTQSWLRHHLSGERQGTVNPKWIVLPTMLVMADASGEELRKAVDEAIQEGLFHNYAVPIGEGEDE